MTTEVTIYGNEYRVGKLPPFKQFHIARRLAPVLAAIGDAALSVPSTEVAKQPQTADEESAEDDAAFGSLMKFVGPISAALSQLTDDDSEYVLNTCLGAVTRKQGNGWAKVSAGNGRLMFEDIELPAMMQLALAVIKENLGNFFPEPPASTSSTAAAA